MELADLALRAQTFSTFKLVLSGILSQEQKTSNTPSTSKKKKKNPNQNKNTRTQRSKESLSFSQQHILQTEDVFGVVVSKSINS
jgi:hypothetical protein